MPGKQHVFLALLAGITDQSEAEHVIASPAKLVDAGALAAFRSIAAGFLGCDSVSSHRIVTPDVAFSTDDVERAVGFHRPDSTQRVSPSADQRPLSAGCILALAKASL